MHVYCKIDTDTNKNKRIVANENTYIKTLETLKGKCNLVTNSESLSDLKDSDIFWTDAMLSMLENMKKNK